MNVFPTYAFLVDRAWNLLQCVKVGKTFIIPFRFAYYGNCLIHNDLCIIARIVIEPCRIILLYIDATMRAIVGAYIAA